jgi:outer membrane protein OmpA-like peptidoglycan-associated protein
MNGFTRISLLAPAAAALAVLLTACQTAPEPDSAVIQARAAVEQAAADPDVSKYAPGELERARNLLASAEASGKGGNAARETAAHYAYLATQTARIAGQRAEEQVAAARIAAGATERQKIIIEAREAQAARARSEAQSAQDRAALAEAQTRELAAQLADLKAQQTPRGMVLTLDDVLFDTGRAELKPGAARSIDQVAQFLDQNPERQVQVEGFTDAQGTDDFNLRLSQSRADAVAQAIIQRGIDAQRVRARGYGEEFPVASNASAGSRQLNRRVEIIVSNDEQAIPGREPR